jgi:ABC-2 type transport system permease protein
LWAVCAGGFGLANSLCGNGWHIPALVTRGQLDVWMLYPRALLPHLLVGRMNPTAVGDAAFGFVTYTLFVHHDLLHLALFTALTISVALLFVGFNVMTGSLAFYLGNVEGLVEQWRFAMITFSTYPATLFEGAVKIILYTVIPAGFVSYLPVEALRNLSLTDALLTLAGSLAVLLVGVVVFYHGLSRYESGNLMEMRG